MCLWLWELRPRVDALPGVTVGAAANLFALRCLLGGAAAICSQYCWTLKSLSRNSKTSARLSRDVLVGGFGSTSSFACFTKGRLGGFDLHVVPKLVAGAVCVEWWEESLSFACSALLLLLLFELLSLRLLVKD